MDETEALLMADAERSAAAYLARVRTRRVFPDEAAFAGLAAFEEELPVAGRPATETLALLDVAALPPRRPPMVRATMGLSLAPRCWPPRRRSASCSPRTSQPRRS